LAKPVRFSNACSLGRLRSAAQLSAGRRRAIKRGHGTIRRFMTLALKGDPSFARGRPTVDIAARRNSQVERMMSDAYGQRLGGRLRTEHAQANIARGLGEGDAAVTEIRCDHPSPAMSGLFEQGDAFLGRSHYRLRSSAPLRFHAGRGICGQGQGPLRAAHSERFDYLPAGRAIRSWRSRTFPGLRSRTAPCERCRERLVRTRAGPFRRSAKSSSIVS
jgi:hypothetical protein